jgi:hypothetical protein
MERLAKTAAAIQGQGTPRPIAKKSRSMREAESGKARQL